MRWKIITLTIIVFLTIVGLIFYLRTIGILRDLESLFLTIISALLLGAPSIIRYCFQPRVILKIRNVRLNEKKVNNSSGYYLTATVLIKVRK